MRRGLRPRVGRGVGRARGEPALVPPVKDPRHVVIADARFIRSHPRSEVRYGDPARPDLARVVATSTIWM
ncbi:hypothetical protein GCM10010371_04030 [Streptomyces subrutilus]|uniref:Uncharacterized protein n=1 Tax=Streptomyces subrutilus TaxID=36818 RepID=A0A918V074_9ACTN|nr:hypothetical protein GCM10010371_04030 [Streptomyces subrutilus]